MKTWRVNLVFFFILLFGAAIISRLVFLQIIDYKYNKALAQGQQNQFQSIKGDRGKIFFSTGQVLATNVSRKYVFVSPEEIENKEETAKTLAQILDLEEKEVLEKIQKENLYAEIKINLSEQECSGLEELELNGVYLEEGVFREYPQGTMASHISGFLGGEEIGQYGIEGYYDDYLQGEESFVTKEKGFGKYFLGKDSVQGNDIYLTIDYNIQFMAEKLLEQAKDNLNIESGQIIVMDPNSGKLMALASFPNFNPNNYSEVENMEDFQDPAIQKLFEPGSVFKPITMAGALDQGKVTPETTYYDEGIIKSGIWTMYNYDQRSYGEQTMTGVLEKSINTGAVFAEKQLGHDNFLDYINRFGFFEPTEIDLQEEVSSENEILKEKYETNLITASFGQGIVITPIQLVRAFSAIANGGKLITPYTAEKAVQGGKTVEIKPNVNNDQIVSQKTSSQLTAMLVSVIENGFAKKAKIPGYYIAGKTGTAQVPWTSLGISKKGYSDKTWQSFIGFAPAFNARFVILVKLDNPATNTAEYSALPIFKELAKYIIDYLEIPPDYE